MHESEKWKWNRSVVADSSRPLGLQPTRLLRPWDFPGKSTGMVCHCLPQYIYIRIWYLSFSFWLTSLCIIGSRFIHFIRTDSNALLLMAEWYSIVYMHHNFFIHSSVDEHLGCFHVLAIVNRAAMNNGIHVSFWILVSSGYMPRSGIAGSYGGFIPSF